MTQTSEAIERNFRAKLDYDQERIDIHTRYLALADSGKHTPSAIYQYILMYNDTLEYPLSAEELSNYSDSLIKEVTPSQEAQEVDALTTYRQAIAEKNTKKLYQCVENLALLKRLSPIQFVQTKEEIKKTFGKDINWRDLNNAISYAERQQALAETGKKPDVADIAQRWAMTYQDTWGYDETTQCWRMWNGEYWEEVEEKGSILDQYTIAALQESGIPVNSTSAMNTFLRIAQSHCKRKFIPAPDKVNFANGTLDTNTGKLTGYGKEDNLTYCLPYNYNAQAKHPNITRYLEETIPDAHGRQALMAHLGLALMGDMYIGVSTGWMRVDGTPARCYHGIRLRKVADSEPTEDIYQSTLLLTDTVNVVNEPSTIKNGIVDGIDQPLAHAQDIPSTMSTINQQYSSIEHVDTYLDNANVSIVEDKSPKTSLTSLTPSIDQPLAHSQPVNGQQKASLTIVDRSLTVATKGERDERGFLVACTIEGCTRLNTNGGNAMCDEHWQAHK